MASSAMHVVRTAGQLTSRDQDRRRSDDAATGPLVLLAPGRGARRKARAGRVLRTVAQIVSPSSAAGDAPGAGDPPVRAVLATKLLTSHRSVWSIASMWSAASLYSMASAGSALSIGSAGSILSIGSAGSILSIGSAGSILCIGSLGSVGTIGGLGTHDVGPSSEAAPIRQLATVLALAALAGGALDGRGAA